jgi:hypothetical protein
MSQIKLNPLVDLGLANDPNFNSQNTSEVIVDVPTSTGSSNSSFNGIVDINSMQSSPVSSSTPMQAASTPSASVTPVTSTTTPSTTTTASPVTEPVVTQTIQSPVVESKPIVSTSSSSSEPSNKTANILFILSIALFLVSIGALIFFVLRFFQIV